MEARKGSGFDEQDQAELDAQDAQDEEEGE